MSAHPLAGLIAGAARIVSGAHVTWLDSPPESGQTVYFANHTSHLDFVVLWSSLPAKIREQTRPVAAADYWEQGGLRRMAAVNAFNAILVQRRARPADEPGSAADAHETIARIAEAMGDRFSLIIFPEGTRGDGEEVGPFKSGLYYLCREKPGLRLVPAYVHNLNRILPKGEFLPVPFISRVIFGGPMALGETEPKAEFLTRARDAVCRLRPA
jgi:1-acyl-sn-glycerol-3-phosphate acyltransferase